MRTKRITAFVALIIAVAAATAGCGKSVPFTELPIPDYYSTYTDQVGLFSISYPPDWEPALSLVPDMEKSIKDILTAVKSDSNVDSARIVFISGKQYGSGYAPNVNIVVQSFPGVVLNHDAVFEASIRGLRQIMPDYREVSRVKTTVGGRQATIFEIEGTYPQLGRIHTLSMMVLVGKTSWLVTCSPPSGEYDAWEDDFQSVLRSLRILQAASD
jgi:hypothetical protein